jgi:hypothetical protein
VSELKINRVNCKGKVYFYYAEQEQVQAHGVRLKMKTYAKANGNLNNCPSIIMVFAREL